MLADLRAAARRLRRAPGFSLLVVLVLALGIGVNVATFGVLDALLFRPPAGVRAPDRVRRLEVAPREQPGRQVFINLGFAQADVDALRARRDRFAPLGAYSAGWEATRTDPALAAVDPERRRVRVTVADPDYFRALGVAPARGRLFGDDESRRGAGDVVVVTDGFWRRAIGADPAAVGRTLHLNGRAYTMVGVLPPGFRGVDVEPADVFAPLASGVALTGYGAVAPDPNMPWLSVVARLAPAADARGAAAVASAVLRAADAARPQPVLGFGAGSAGRQVRARALTEHFAGGHTGPESPVPLWLLGATAAVLLVACANVANLLLVRAERRRREIATRAAVGAGRGRLVRQLLAEGLVLAAAGGAFGLALAALAARLFRLVPGVPAVDGLVGGRAAGFAVAVTAATTLLFALAPAVAAARAGDGAELLRSGARQLARGAPLRTALIGVQFAASLALLGAGGLFVRSLRNVRAVDLGFDAERLLVASVDWRAFGLSDAARGVAQRAAAERLRGTPGVAAVSRAMMAPYAGVAMKSLRVPGRGDLGAVSGVPGGMFFTNEVDTAYATTLGTPVVRGRWLAPGDEAFPGAVAVNEAFARRVWPGEDALGRCVFLDADRDVCTRVVGVVRDARLLEITGEVAPIFYRLASDANAAGEILVRVRPGAPPAEVARVAAAVGASLRAAEPRVGFATAATVADRAFGQALAPYRLAAAAFTLFGALALGIAAVGLYGAAAYVVAQRAGEFGVRMALGARGRDVAALVLAQGLRTVALGGAAGAAGAVAVGRLLRARLYGVGPLDPVSLGVTAAVLAGAALLAAWLPARRAARVDPATALRTE
ncbi:hypothetical protein tb265_41750 [Gemmatimonadetes bacterium T265]|nr:hypothetical protein tb265_41750 [Gemmatimonadetes bacterium T265]